MKKYVIGIIALFVILIISYYQFDSMVKEAESKTSNELIFETKDTLLLSTKDTLVVKDTVRKLDVINDFLQLEEPEKATHQLYYIVVLDQGLNYKPLQSKMVSIHEKHQIKIDSMGRYYNSNKNRIVLPDDDKDELYAGDYFPRRFPSEYLSLEYLNVYREVNNDDEIALIGGVYDSVDKADSLLQIVKEQVMESYILKSKVYTGCMH